MTQAILWGGSEEVRATVSQTKNMEQRGSPSALTGAVIHTTALRRTHTEPINRDPAEDRQHQDGRHPTMTMEGGWFWGAFEGSARVNDKPDISEVEIQIFMNTGFGQGKECSRTINSTLYFKDNWKRVQWLEFTYQITEGGSSLAAQFNKKLPCIPNDPF